MKAEMALCWKLVWKVEPAALMVPLTVLVLALVAGAALDEVLPVAAGLLAGAEDELDDEDDEHAARASAATTAVLTVATCFLPRNCIKGFSF